MTTLAPRTTIVTALPATGYVGQVVVLTTNGHLYNWTGATWLDNGASGGGGGLSDGDYGDVTVSGSGTAISIDNNAVTSAKINSGAVTTAKLGGDITSAGKALLDDADASAQRTTLGLGALSTAVVLTQAVAFTDGDTLRRVSVSSGSLTSSSNVVASITRPDTASDANDPGLVYVPTVVRRYTGGCDVLISCIGWGQDDPVGLVNETITLTLIAS